MSLTHQIFSSNFLIPSTFLTNKTIISLLTFWAKQTIVEHNMYILNAKVNTKIFNPFGIKCDLAIHSTLRKKSNNNTNVAKIRKKSRKVHVI